MKNLLNANMLSKFILPIILIFCLSLPTQLNAQRKWKEQAELSARDTLTWSVKLLKTLLQPGSEWYIVDDNYRKPVKEILDHVDYVPIDTFVTDMREILRFHNETPIFERRPQDIRDRSRIPGYIQPAEEAQLIEQRKRNVIDSLHRTNIQLPPEILQEALMNAPLVPQGNANDLFFKSDKMVPLSFMTRFNKNLSAMPLPPNMTGTQMDSIRIALFNQNRQAYNDSVISQRSDSLLVIYREKFINNFAAKEADNLKKSIVSKNLKALTAFNESEVQTINDSLKVALHYLTQKADGDSVLIKLSNFTGDQSPIWTANRAMPPMRTYLKNAQNDSLGVILYNDGKGKLRLVIDDGMKFTRFVESQQKEITFQPRTPDNKLLKMNIKKPEALAWNLFGNGTVGFTQTHLSNWAKGGESALSLLFVGKYNANYSKKKIKWENSAEFRYGVNQTKARGFEKNDDKIEIQSRFGYSAFKNWYYSAESNFRTQIAKGYKYPDKTNPISTFMAPGYSTISLGMDYKPNKNFSLFLSPLTSKTTYIRDTALINPVNYGLEPGTKKLWEPGIIVKANWKTTLRENITYETKGEFFNNYRYPFKKVTFEWEQLLILQVTRHINTRVMTQLIYDHNTKFPIYDDAGNVVDKKPKWQFKELLTIGFTYKF